MKTLERLLSRNKTWAAEKTSEDNGYFERLAKDQTPDVLWIGCSDSRVPAEVIVNAQPGDIFVHRNIANQIVATDFNSLSVLQYAVDVLKVNHVIVCGHYQCGGIKAALDKQRSDLVLVNKWLIHIKEVYRLHQDDIECLESQERKVNRLVELNVIEQLHKLSHTSIIQHAWKSQRRPMLHGWVYGLDNGLIEELATLGPDHRLEPIYDYCDIP